ncbi:MAG TPA: zinc ribbon domain-containing protein [Burkholderiales bacterium]|jgi:putative FmdB family regulatory protein
MPIYEYRCGSCGFEKEYLQKLSDPPITDCPTCGKPAMTKLVSAAGFQLKGTGWYATDFKNGSRKPPGDRGKGGAPGGSEGSGTGDAKKDTPKADSAAAPACGTGACPACQ